jgi:glyoxylase-like metal-dependent hydrolase (beta-lactamase superfamily II)
VTYSVWVEQAADLGAVPGAEVFWMRRFDEWLPMHVYIGIVRGHGKTVLINTGPPEAYIPYMNEVWRHELGAPAQIRVEEAHATLSILRRHGLTPEDVDAVVVTPLQAYAIGNVDRFPRAEICISRTGWIDLFAPKHFDPRRKMAVPDHLLSHLLFEAWPKRRVRLLEDEDEVFPGIRTWWAGTHHRSSLAVEVDTPRGTVIFSDVAFYYENLEQDIPLGILESMAECKDAYERIRRSASHFVSLYDPRTLERYPGGVVA